MTRLDFVNKVVEIYFRDNCSVETAIHTAIKELKLTTYEYLKIVES